MPPLVLAVSGQPLLKERRVPKEHAKEQGPTLAMGVDEEVAVVGPLVAVAVAVLSIEHRATASCAGLQLELRKDGNAIALALNNTPAVEANVPEPQSLAKQIHQALQGSDQPLTVAELRRICRVRTSTLCDALAALAAEGTVKKVGRGYQLPG